MKKSLRYKVADVYVECSEKLSYTYSGTKAQNCNLIRYYWYSSQSKNITKCEI